MQKPLNSLITYDLLIPADPWHFAKRDEQAS